MAIDPNIILSLRNPQFNDPTDTMQKLMALQASGMQLGQARREEQYQKTIGDLYKQNMTPGGSVNPQGVVQGLAAAGLGARIPAFQKQLQEADNAKQTLELNKAKTAHESQQTEASKFKLMRDRQEASNGVLASLLSKPVVTHDDVIRGVTSLIQQGYASPEQGAALVRELPGRPEDLRAYLTEKAIQGLDAAKRIELLTPKFEKIDTGGTVLPGTVNNMTGEFTPNPKKAIKKTATPGELLSSETSRRGQNMTDSRERELANLGVTYQQADTGELVMLPNKVQAGKVPSATPVLGKDGQPVMGKNALTEDQGKATGWLSQARNAYSNALTALKANPDALTPGLGDAIGKIPGMGAPGRMVQSGERQQFNQAMSSMSEALLRAATGAGINVHEAKQKIEELTPQFGDKEAVIKNKMDAIPVYLKSLEVRAGPGARKLTTVPNPTSDSGVPEDIQAILKKHGGAK